MKLKFKSITSLIAKFTPLALFAVLGLALAAPQTAQAGNYYKFTVLAVKANPKASFRNQVAISELALYDAGRNRINSGLTMSSSATLDEGQAYISAGEIQKGKSSPSDNSPLFNGTNYTEEKWFVNGSSTISALNQYVVMRLADDANPVVFYNIASADNAASVADNRLPAEWTLEYSSTGLDGSWREIAHVTLDDSDLPTTDKTWYNGGGAQSTDKPPSKFFGRNETRPSSVGSVANLSAGYYIDDDYVMIFDDPSKTGSFTLTANASAWVLAVGGGGSGGFDRQNGAAGGGGAGAFLERSTQALANGVAYNVVVGAGGASVNTAGVAGNNGKASYISSTAGTLLCAIGGGGGGSSGSTNGLNGGSGGGGGAAAGSATTVPLSGEPGGSADAVGQKGGSSYSSGGANSGGGGGGAGAVGSSGYKDTTANTSHGGNGGAGLSSQITGMQVWYAGGGGGGAHGGDNIAASVVGQGGLGGGGRGGQTSSVTDYRTPVAGAKGTGGGGGGSGYMWADFSSGAGGSGIVIVRLSASTGPTLGEVTLNKTSVTWNDSGWATLPTVTVKNGAGQTLTLNTDYTIGWKDSADNPISGTTVSKADIYTVTVTGKAGSDYEGQTKTATYTVKRKQVPLPPSPLQSNVKIGTKDQGNYAGKPFPQEVGNALPSDYKGAWYNTSYIKQGSSYSQKENPGTYTDPYFMLNSSSPYAGNIEWADGTTGNKNVTWTINETRTTVTLNNGSGTTGGQTSVKIQVGSVVPALGSVPKKTDYSLTGYYSAATGGVKFYNGDGTRASDSGFPSGITVLYAQWEEGGGPIAMPKPRQRTFKYASGTTQTIVLEPTPEDGHYDILSGGDTSAIEPGIYQFQVKPKGNFFWKDDESQSPRTIEWGIVPSDYTEPFGADRSFLKTLENSQYRVAASALPSGITGGDIFLRFPNVDGAGNIVSHDFVHIFTNTAASGFVFENNSGSPRQGRALIVGGGGASGYTQAAGGSRTDHITGGGGGGGAVRSLRELVLDGAYSIKVGRGGVPASSKGRGNSGESSSLENSSCSWVVLGGGGGGKSSSTDDDANSNGLSAGTGGGAGAKSGSAGTGGADGYDGGVPAGYSTGSWSGNFLGAGGGGAGRWGESGNATGQSGGYGFFTDILSSPGVIREYVCFGGGGAGGGTGESGHSKTLGGFGGGGNSYLKKATEASFSDQNNETGVNGLGGGGSAASTDSFLARGGTDVAKNGGDGIVIIRYTDTVQTPKIMEVEIPAIEDTYTFNYERHDVLLKNSVVKLADTEYYTVSGDLGGVYIQEYTVTLTLRDPDNMQWSNGQTQPQTLTWSIVHDKYDDDRSFFKVLATNHNRIATAPLGLTADIVLRSEQIHDSTRYYRYELVYKDSASITFNTAVNGAEVLLVGGGGAGGNGNNGDGSGGGGGGAGGVKYVKDVSFVANQAYALQVGQGGQSASANGAASTIDTASGMLTAGGGGGGGRYDANGKDSALGSAGGGGGSGVGGTAQDANLGHNGGDGYNHGGNSGGGAGGGAGGQGQSGGNQEEHSAVGRGGNGVQAAIFVSGGLESQYFGGGGAGGFGGSAERPPCSGGLGGGGSTWPRTFGTNEPGVDGLGGGGAGGSATGAANNPGRPGGDGIIVIAFEIPAGALIDKPTLGTDRFTYSGNEVVVTDYLSSFEHMTATGTDQATNVGDYQFAVTPASGYEWSDMSGSGAIAFNWSIAAKPIQGNITVPAIPAQTYTGLPITPEFEVRDTARNVVLTLGTDYTAEYFGNVNIGTATIKLTGIGNYTATENTTFQIIANPNENSFFVTPEGGGSGTGWEDPTTLANALSASASSDKPVAIYMKKGTYTDGNWTLPLADNAQPVSILGGYEGLNLVRSATENSVLDGGNSKALLALTVGQSSHVTLTRLTFKDGGSSTAAALSKAGLGNLSVAQCKFIGNGRKSAFSSTDDGDADKTLNQTDFTDCAFIGNNSTGNGALMLYHGTTFDHCLFAKNTGSGNAGAVYVGKSKQDYVFRNCTFVANSVSGTNGEGSIHVYHGTVKAYNSIFHGTGVQVYGGQDGPLTCNYCLFNSDGAIRGTNTTINNPIYATDPQFANISGDDATAWDVHLKSTEGRYKNGEWVTDDVSSPAIDAGDPAADCSAEPKNSAGQNFGLNLGIYGNTAQASMSPVRQNVTVTFEKGEGIGGTASVTGLEGTAMPAVLVPTRENYNFLGYFTATAGGGTQYYGANGQPVGSPSPVFSTSVTTLYANWEAATVTVTLNANGGSDGATTSVTATNGQPMPTIAAANLPTRTGYTFAGFFENQDGTGKQYYNANGTSANNYDKTAASTIYAKWTANKYRVHFNGNGETSGSMGTEGQLFTYDVEQKLTKNQFARVFTVSFEGGFEGQISSLSATATFSGWAKSEDGAAEYGDEAPVKNLSSTHGAQIYLYAKWTDGSITLPTPTKTGCTFVGWYTAASGGSKVGDAGASYTPTATTTLYAQWLTQVAKPTAETGLVYNGSEQTGVAAATGYTVENGKKTNAGNYTATAKLASGYCWNDGTTGDESIPWLIDAAPLTLTPAHAAITYGDAKPTDGFSWTGSGYVGGQTSVVVTGTPSYSTTYEQGSNVGSYPITLSGLSAPNYAITFAEGALAVNQAENVWTTMPKLSAATFPANRPATITWGVAQFGGEATATLDKAAFARSGALPANLSVGEHELVFTVAGTSNYTALSETINFTVTDALYDLHAISATGPVIKDVPSSWLAAAFDGVAADQYQTKFLEENANGVKAWAAYILGFEGSDVPTAAIIEKTTASEMSGGKVTLTVALPDMPTARTVDGCTLAYSLLTSDNAETLRTGGGDVVDGCLKISSSSFTVPLSIPTDANHVYYRIRIHFIFTGGGGDNPELIVVDSLTITGEIDVRNLPVGWVAKGTEDDAGATTYTKGDFQVISTIADIPENYKDYGYIGITFSVTSKFDICSLITTYLDEGGKTVSDSGINSQVRTGFNSTNEQEISAVYRIPPDATCEGVNLEWRDSNAARVEYYNGPNHKGDSNYLHKDTDFLISDVAVELFGYSEAASRADAIFTKHVNQDAWNAVIPTELHPEKQAWTRNLSSLKDALTSGQEYKILMMGDSTSCAPQNGCAEALIKRQWPNSNIKFYLLWQNNSGCYHYAGLSTTNNKKEFAESFDYSPYDLIIFSGISQTRDSGPGGMPSEKPEYGINTTNAVRMVMDMIRSDALGSRKNTHCQFLMMSSLLSVDSRGFGTSQGGGTYDNGWIDQQYYASDVQGFFEQVGKPCPVNTAWDIEKDIWAKRDYLPIREAMPEFCKDKGIPHWDFFPAAYQYLYRSGKYFQYYSRDAVHPNVWGYQVAARLVFEAFKLVAEHDYSN